MSVPFHAHIVVYATYWRAGPRSGGFVTDVVLGSGPGSYWRRKAP
jgi:hypothetical protein